MTFEQFEMIEGRPFSDRPLHRSDRHDSPVLASETAIEVLAGRRVLCIMDDDNMRIGLRNLGFALSYRTLQARLSDTGSALESWVVLSDHDGAVTRGRYLDRRGWNVVQVPRQLVVHRGVPTLKGNADHELAFLAGRRSSEAAFDSLLLGTGDGDLAVAVARCVKEFTTASVVTLSVPGCSSQRLTDAGLFDGRVLIGRDLVYRLGRSGRRGRTVPSRPTSTMPFPQRHPAVPKYYPV